MVVSNNRLKSPLVTVLITAHNYGRFVEEAIDSVLSQEYPADRVETLVVDDGSTDDTAERVKKYGSKISYVYQPNGGQASALNLGFAKSSGEIIVLLDADDYFLPGKLARVTKAFEDDPELGMFYHPFQEFDMQTGERRVSKFPLVSGSLSKNPENFLSYYGPGTSVSFRKTSLDRLLPIPGEIRMLADCYIGSLIVFVAPILAVPECLGAYRFHGRNSLPYFANPFHAEAGQVSPEVLKDKLREWQIVVAAMFKWLAGNGYTQDQPAVEFFHDRWRLYIESQVIAQQVPGRLRFFSYLMRYNRCYASRMTRRLRVINFVNAYGALLTGYKHFHVLDDLRMKIARSLRRMLGPSVPSA
jgi:glycosyltransferase involved in cell wall biosynthesis